MSGDVREFRVMGVHPVVPTAAEFAEAVEMMRGENLVGAQRVEAEKRVAEHFAGLFLVEVQVEPADAEVDWIDVTQPVAGVDRSNWQVPYDEQVVESGSGRWAFFLHCVQLEQPLMTSVGARPLPGVTPRPAHLAGIRYEVP